MFRRLVAEAHEGARGAGAQDLLRIGAVLRYDAAHSKVRPGTAQGKPFLPLRQLQLFRIEGAQKGIDKAGSAPFAHLFDEGNGVIRDHIARLVQKQQHIQRHFEQDPHRQLRIFGCKGTDAEIEIAVVFQHAIAEFGCAGALGRFDRRFGERLLQIGASAVYAVQNGIGVVERVGHRISPNTSPTATLRPLTASAARSIFPPANCSSVTRRTPPPVWT